MTILLLGSSGFLGQHVATRLKAAGHDVWRFSRRTNQLGDNCVACCDLIINCAGNTENPDSMLEDNCVFARQVIMAARVFKKRLIHVGSILEDIPGYSLYKQTKIDATKAALEAANDLLEPVDVCVVKPATLYGAGDKDSAFLPTLWRAYANHTTFTCQDQFRFWIHVRDAADGINAIVNLPRTKGHTFSLKDLYIPNRTLLETFGQCVGVSSLNVAFEEATSWPQKVPGEYPPLWDGPKVDLRAGVNEFVLDQMKHESFFGAEA